MTPNVNSYSKDARIQDSQDWSTEAKASGFLAGNDDQLKWWKGRGGFIDYTNPAAVDWWRARQQTVFDYGIDGWKLDGSATLFGTRLGSFPLFYKRTSQGLMTTRRYMDHYYRQEYFHGLAQNPEFVTLSRSMDYKWFHPEGFAPFDASPVNWVGDQTHTWEATSSDPENGEDLAMNGAEGIEMAIERILRSARTGWGDHSFLYGKRNAIGNSVEREKNTSYLEYLLPNGAQIGRSGW